MPHDWLWWTLSVCGSVIVTAGTVTLHLALTRKRRADEAWRYQFQQPSDDGHRASRRLWTLPRWQRWPLFVVVMGLAAVFGVYSGDIFTHTSFVHSDLQGTGVIWLVSSWIGGTVLILLVDRDRERLQSREHDTHIPRV